MDVVVLWHPDDRLGPLVAEALVDHFHGTVFSGLIGGAVEVYVRWAGWSDVLDQVLRLAGSVRALDVVTPRQLAARAG